MANEPEGATKEAVGIVTSDLARGSVSRWLTRGAGACSLVVALGLLATLPASLPAQAAGIEDEPPALSLVTLNGPGTTGVPGMSRNAAREILLAEQDEVLSTIGGASLTYRWTTALNGFAADLTPDQVATLQGDSRVSLVEPNDVHPLAALPRAQTGRLVARTPRMRGGEGVVIGVVDSGIAPESAVFAAVPGLGRYPKDFTGGCEAASGWTSASCNRKVVGANWFVDGFGADRIRTSESLSAQDSLGHGTQVASVAAGNARVSVRINGRGAGQFGGVAPQARIAAYKACWGAPDPADDGCATADIVTAVDQAVSDGVDVLALAIAGGSEIDTVQHALLGAAEADVVAIAAAGNTRRDSFAAHSTPWVTTVGSTVGRLSRGTLRVAGGPTLTGAGRIQDTAGRVVLAGQAHAPGIPARLARQCRPGTLDARKVADRVVICERGGIARVAKSDAVDQADGAAMVLVNVRRGGVSADLHAVPTIHLTMRDGKTLKRWIRTHGTTKVRLRKQAPSSQVARAARWSAAGDPRGPALKPDLVAPGGSILGATSDSTAHNWGVFSGSSAATAQVAGVAALLRSRHDWSAPVIRSVLSSATVPVRARSVFDSGAGSLNATAATSAHLGFEVAPGAWRRALESGRWGALNIPSLMLSPGHHTATRTLTNLGTRAEYFSVTTQGFSTHRVSVRPLAVRLGPGESATFRVTVTRTRPGLGLDDGELVWLGARGSRAHLPVALTR